MEAFKPVTHLIFDLDGLLLNTEDLYFKIDSEVIGQYGKQYSKKLKQKVLGTTELRSAEIIVEELKLPVTPEDYLQQVKKLQSERLSEVDLMPGVEKLVRHLHNNGVPIAIATSASFQSYELKTTKHRQLFSLFDHVVAGSSDPDVKEGKPAPDVFLVCAKRFKDQPLPCDCLVFEDAPNGVKAAVRAGMQVVMVPEDYIEKHLREDATLVLDTLEDFKPELFSLPAYPENTKNLY